MYISYILANLTSFCLLNLNENHLINNSRNFEKNELTIVTKNFKNIIIELI